MGDKYYKRDMPRRGEMDDELFDNYMMWAEQFHHTFKRMDPGGMYHGMSTLLRELNAPEGVLPSYDDFNHMGMDEQTRAIQRAYTYLSQYRDPDYQPGNGEGEGEGKSNGASAPRPKNRREESNEYHAQRGGGGGGYNRSEDKDQSIFEIIRALILKLVDAVDQSQVDDAGTDRWNAKRVYKATWNLPQLPSAKDEYGRTIDNIYLLLDTSGSVSHYTKQIAAMAAGAAGYVHIFTGSEANPESYVPRTTPLKYAHEHFPEWIHQVEVADDTLEFREFIDRMQEEYPDDNIGHHELTIAFWLQKYKVPKGSRIIFWGDTEGCGIGSPRVLKRVLDGYKVVWMLPGEKYSHDVVADGWDRPYPTDEQILNDFSSYQINYGDLPDYFIMEALGIPCIFGVEDAAGMREAIQFIS